MANEQSQNGGWSIKSIKSHTQMAGVLQMCTCAHKGWKWGDRVGRIEKLVMRSARTKWITPNRCHFLCIGPAKYPRASSPAREMLLFPFIIIHHVLLFHVLIYFFHVLIRMFLLLTS